MNHTRYDREVQNLWIRGDVQFGFIGWLIKLLNQKGVA